MLELVLFSPGKFNFLFPLFAGSIDCTLFLLDCFDFAHECVCICVYSMIFTIISLILYLPFVWGSSLFSQSWIFVLISLNAITNHLWNLCFWPEIKSWTSGVGALTPDPRLPENSHREYQIVRTHTQETTWTQDPASPNHQQHPVQDASAKQHTKHKYKLNHQQIGLPPHSALPRRGNTNKQKLSTNLTLHKAYTTTGPALGGQKPKERIQPSSMKEFNFA